MEKASQLHQSNYFVSTLTAIILECFFIPSAANYTKSVCSQTSGKGHSTVSDQTSVKFKSEVALNNEDDQQHSRMVKKQSKPKKKHEVGTNRKSGYYLRTPRSFIIVYYQELT